MSGQDGKIDLPRLEVMARTYAESKKAFRESEDMKVTDRLCKTLTNLEYEMARLFPSLIQQLAAAREQITRLEGDKSAAEVRGLKRAANLCRELHYTPNRSIRVMSGNDYGFMIDELAALAAGRKP